MEPLSAQRIRYVVSRQVQFIVVQVPFYTATREEEFPDWHGLITSQAEMRNELDVLKRQLEERCVACQSYTPDASVTDSSDSITSFGFRTASACAFAGDTAAAMADCDDEDGQGGPAGGNLLAHTRQARKKQRRKRRTEFPIINTDDEDYLLESASSLHSSPAIIDDELIDMIARGKYVATQDHKSEKQRACSERIGFTIETRMIETKNFRHVKIPIKDRRFMV